MKILLVGEYNKAHFNIKKGLEELGHEAVVVANRDGFKKVDVDIEIKDHYTSFLLKKIRVFLYLVFKIDLLALSVKKQFKEKKKELSGFDIVQFINEAPFPFERKSHTQIFNWLCDWNDCSFYLLSCGLDYPSVKYAYDKKFRYDILTPYFENKGSKKDFSPALSYLSPEHIKLHKYLFSKIEGVIGNDLDYHLPLLNHPKYLGMIPHAINLDELKFEKSVVTDKVVIFHGINRYNYYKKGNDIFEAALKIIEEKFSDKVEIIVAENLPYKQYINSFDKAHILLDQVYAYDQGFNALEAMAKGKVVFTGAEKEWLEYYSIKEDTIAINALPEVENIVTKLEWLISNPDKISDISVNARIFVEKYHNHIDCAKKYLEIWDQTKPS
ncbi:glycosyltransferase [Winogradskyella sp. SYSU M77433]|uniref:glycosyltransferase n=1 Tax=Winogradskyella sp. SYSU M77433 TaxID=3042722 RepID=UPI0024815DE8|nr:glycosyltransferase [Winogradskyella sp. SYSU M77433]MDH7913177.1 glycosyltransferase [Winogradskyella sp. SYSU M77433]